MATKITMPKLSDTMSEGILLKWLKKEGDSVEAAEVIAEAESDKATMELEAFDSGIMRKILVPEGGKVPVGGTLAIVGEKDEDISELLKEPKVTAAEKPEPAPAEEEVKPVPAAPVVDKPPPDRISTTDSVRIKASPLARKMASDGNIDLRKVTGTGSGGRIIKRDILKVSSGDLAGGITPRGEERELKLSTMREVIAQRMTLSKTTVPHFYLTVETDMKAAVELRSSLKQAQADVKISYNDFIVRAAALALQKHHLVNGRFDGDRIVLHGSIDIGVAVALEDGLITPVIRSCDAKGVAQISAEIRDLARRARERKLGPEEYTDATFTISNLGMYKIEEFSAIINPPQAAVLAVGAVLDKPVIENDAVTIGKRMKMTLSCDHRIVDGATGATFLQAVRTLLENPLRLLL